MARSSCAFATTLNDSPATTGDGTSREMIGGPSCASTRTVACCVPLCAVICAEPGLREVTRPSWLTSSTEVSLELQSVPSAPGVRSTWALLLSSPVKVSCTEAPTRGMLAPTGFRSTEVKVALASTMTCACAETPP